MKTQPKQVPVHCLADVRNTPAFQSFADIAKLIEVLKRTETDEDIVVARAEMQKFYEAHADERHNARSLLESVYECRAKQWHVWKQLHETIHLAMPDGSPEADAAFWVSSAQPFPCEYSLLASFSAVDVALIARAWAVDHTVITLYSGETCAFDAADATLACIAADNADKLTDILNDEQSGIALDTVLPAVLCAYNVITVAAACGSVNAFKRALLLGEGIVPPGTEDVDDFVESAWRAAIYGGSTDIIHIIEQELQTRPELAEARTPPDGVVAAARAHRNDLADWFVLSDGTHNARGALWTFLFDVVCSRNAAAALFALCTVEQEKGAAAAVARYQEAIHAALSCDSPLLLAGLLREYERVSLVAAAPPVPQPLDAALICTYDALHCLAWFTAQPGHSLQEECRRARDARAWTPLLSAVRFNRIAVVTYLLAQRVPACDVNEALSPGEADRNQYECLPLMAGATALHIAAMHEGDTAVADLLIAHGADVFATDAGLRTPLHTACYFDNPDAVKLLVGIMGTHTLLAQRDVDGASPFDAAACCHMREAGSSFFRVMRLCATEFAIEPRMPCTMRSPMLLRTRREPPAQSTVQRWEVARTARAAARLHVDEGKLERMLCYGLVKPADIPVGMAVHLLVSPYHMQYSPQDALGSVQEYYRNGEDVRMKDNLDALWMTKRERAAAAAAGCNGTTARREDDAAAATDTESEE